MGEAARTVAKVSTLGLSEIGGGGNAIQQGVDDFVGDVTGAKGADAAGKAAMAQAAEARASREAILGMSKSLSTDAMNFAKMSPDEMRAFSASLDAGHRQLDSDQKLLDAIDPTLMEASSKILSLLRGENPAPRSMDALTAARDQQRAQLVDRLRTQLGPGAETSSVGLKALRDFDIASSSNLAQQSQQFDMNDQAMQLNKFSSLNQIMGTAASMRPDLMRTGMNMTNLSSIFKNRELSTKLQTGGLGLSALSGANAPVIQSAGAQYVGDQMRAQGMQSLYGNLLQGGMQIAGKYATGGAGGAGGK